MTRQLTTTRIPLLLLFVLFSVVLQKPLFAQESVFKKNGWAIQGSGGVDQFKKEYANGFNSSLRNGFYGELGVQKLWRNVGLELSTRYYANKTPNFDSTGISQKMLSQGFIASDFTQKNPSLQRASISLGPVFNLPFLKEKVFVQISALGGVSVFKDGFSLTNESSTIAVLDRGYTTKSSLTPSGRANFKIGYNITQKIAIAANAYYTYYFNSKQPSAFYDINKAQVENTTYSASSYGAGLTLSYNFGKKTVVEPKKLVPVIPQKMVNVTMRDIQTGEPLVNAKVKLLGDNGKIFNSVTNELGEAVFDSIPQARYRITGLLNDIASTEGEIIPTQFDLPGKGIYLKLDHNDPRFTLKGFTVNKTTQLREGKVYVVLTNLKTNVVKQVVSEQGTGEFSFQIDGDTDYSVFGRKDMYISEIENASTKGLERSTVLYVKLALPLEQAETGKVIKLENIYYDLDKADIREDASRDLNKLVQFMVDNPNAKIELNAHTDSRGTAEYNMILSQKRAESVVEFLTNHGISSNRLIARGYGESKLTNACADGIPCSEEFHQANRRTEFMVIE